MLGQNSYVTFLLFKKTTQFSTCFLVFISCFVVKTGKGFNAKNSLLEESQGMGSNSYNKGKIFLEYKCGWALENQGHAHLSKMTAADLLML